MVYSLRLSKRNFVNSFRKRMLVFSKFLILKIFRLKWWISPSGSRIDFVNDKLYFSFSIMLVGVIRVWYKFEIEIV